MSTAILWLRRNLRLTDNASLEAAVNDSDSVLPVYVSDDLDRGGASRWWLHHSLASLERSIADQGGRLIVDRGNPATILARLAKTIGADTVYATRRYEPEARAQEESVTAALAGSASLEICDDSLLYRPAEVTTKTGGAYKVFTPFYRASVALGDPSTPLPRPGSIPWHDGDDVAGRPLADLECLPTNPDWSGGLAETWQPGEGGALLRLDEMQNKIEGYGRGRDFPAEDATSRLSPHLSFGELSPRQVWHGISSVAHERRKEDSAEPLLRQLSWRDFSAYLLHHHPSMTDKPLRKEFAAFPWHDNDVALKAWQRGRTGYPIVDAGMRQLWHTGWMHNRVRMIVASLLVKHLLIPWQRGAEWFADTLVDADAANNSAGWQWVAGSGTDAAPYFRVFNPITQGQKFDPDAEYIQRWIPELRGMPRPFIFEPWTADALTRKTAGVEIGEDYPYPIIEHKAGREQALAAYQLMRERNAA